ncbi:MAG: nuclear transport factor 2 family protein [Ferruginibacter sp.]|nr:nuclear transport factor 2 family protein [Chitinophagaceae bacterium]
MKKVVMGLVILFIANQSSFAQANSDKDKVHSAMMDYIEGFYEGDSGKIIRSISQLVVKYGYWKEKTSAVYAGEPMSYREMIDYAVSEGKKTKKAKIGALEKAELYEVQDLTASGKVTAWWGTDYLLLEKVNDRWMIRMILWQGPLKK